MISDGFVSWFWRMENTERHQGTNEKKMHFHSKLISPLERKQAISDRNWVNCIYKYKFSLHLCYRWCELSAINSLWLAWHHVAVWQCGCCNCWCCCSSCCFCWVFFSGRFPSFFCSFSLFVCHQRKFATNVI